MVLLAGLIPGSARIKLGFAFILLPFLITYLAGAFGHPFLEFLALPAVSAGLAAFGVIVLVSPIIEGPRVAFMAALFIFVGLYVAFTTYGVP